MTATSGTIITSWMSTAAGRPESVGKSARIEKPATCSRDASKIATPGTPAAAGNHN